MEISRIPRLGGAKRCIFCQEFKPIDRFGHSTPSPDGHSHHCLECDQTWGLGNRMTRPQRRKFKLAAIEDLRQVIALCERQGVPEREARSLIAKDMKRAPKTLRKWLEGEPLHLVSAVLLKISCERVRVAAQDAQNAQQPNGGGGAAPAARPLALTGLEDVVACWVCGQSYTSRKKLAGHVSARHPDAWGSAPPGLYPTGRRARTAAEPESAGLEVEAQVTHPVATLEVARSGWQPGPVLLLLLVAAASAGSALLALVLAG